MTRKPWLVGALCTFCLLFSQSVALGGTSTLEFGAADLATYTTFPNELGTFHTMQVTVPADVLGKRLDAVLLELYLDVSLKEGAQEESLPVFQILPLTSAYAGDGIPAFAPTSPAARIVAPGERRRMVLDITEIVRGWISNPETNHGLIIGSFTGLNVGTFTLRDDMLAGGKVAKVTFMYQNRFGGRVPH